MTSYKNMKHFRPHEFRGWGPSMAESLLVCMDRFREEWGAPVGISLASGALGRHQGPDKTSAHNIDKWRVVYGSDLFPVGMVDESDRARAYRAARAAFATGIGLYTDTQYLGKRANMIHLDTRPSRTPDDPALWSRVDGVYRPITGVLPPDFEL